MLDSAFGIFNNLPPRFQWSEIDLPFPSDDEYFKIPNYEAMVAKHLFPQPKMKLKDAFMVLFSNPESGKDNLEALRAGHLTALDMQMLIHCKHFLPISLSLSFTNTNPVLYTHAWLATFSNPLASLPTSSIPVLLHPFKIALQNWKVVWNEIRSSLGETEWNKLGFQRTAETYSDAVQCLLTIFEKREGIFPPLMGDCEKGNHLKRLLSFG